MWGLKRSQNNGSGAKREKFTEVDVTHGNIGRKKFEYAELVRFVPRHPGITCATCFSVHCAKHLARRIKSTNCGVSGLLSRTASLKPCSVHQQCASLLLVDTSVLWSNMSIRSAARLHANLTLRCAHAQSLRFLGTLITIRKPYFQAVCQEQTVGPV